MTCSFVGGGIGTSRGGKQGGEVPGAAEGLDTGELAVVAAFS